MPHPSDQLRSAAEHENALGTEHAKRREWEPAITRYRRAIELAPDLFKPHNNLGNVLREQGDREGAVACYRAALRIEPTAHRVLGNLGNTLRDLGRDGEAADAYRAALRLSPSGSIAIRLGQTLELLADDEGAVAAYREGAALGDPDARLLLGSLLTRRGDREAVTVLRAAVSAEPGRAEAHRALGAALERWASLDEAVTSYREAVRLAPASVDARVDLGIVLRALGRSGEAVAVLGEVIARDAALGLAHQNLGLALADMGSLGEARVALEKALALEPLVPERHANLATVLVQQGDIHEAVAVLRRALEVAPTFVGGHQNLLFTMQYDDAYAAELVDEHARFARRHADPRTSLRAPPQDAGRDPGRRLRIGYVSPDFRRHSVASFLDAILRGHDRARFEVFCYSDVARPDEVTRRFASLDLTFSDVRGMSDDELAARVRADRIDVLVDLAGHTSGNRLLVFARRPAPVQVTYLGYPDTTGMAAMGYRLTDPVADPVDDHAADARCAETLVRLPRAAWCFAPYEEAEGETRAPAPTRDHVCFGSFNVFAKVRPQVLATWASILRAVPGSRLLLKAKSLRDEELRRRVLGGLAEQGIAEERVELRGWEPERANHLGLYAEVDVALDTFPYNGTTTTCEALWMGVPVVTLAGRTHASRVGASLLHSVGLDDLVARTTGEYVARAVAVANDPVRRARLRAELRATLRRSAVGDAEAFVADLEAAYRSMWASAR